MLGNFDTVVLLTSPSTSSGFLLIAECRLLTSREGATAAAVVGVADLSCRRRRSQLCSSAAGGVSLVAGSQSKHRDMKSTNSSSLQLFKADTSDFDPGAPCSLRCLAAVGGPAHLYGMKINETSRFR